MDKRLEEIKRILFAKALWLPVNGGPASGDFFNEVKEPEWRELPVPEVRLGGANTAGKGAEGWVSKLNIGGYQLDILDELKEFAGANGGKVPTSLEAWPEDLRDAYRLEAGDGGFRDYVYLEPHRLVAGTKYAGNGMLDITFFDKG